LAAIFGKERNEAVHRLEASRIDHRAAFAAHSDEARVAQTIKMKRQSVGREIESGCHLPGRHSFRSSSHQDSEHIESIALGKRSQSGQCINAFHISINTEIIKDVKNISIDIEMSAEVPPLLLRLRAWRSIPSGLPEGNGDEGAPAPSKK
jgi:hypothetical protein